MNYYTNTEMCEMHFFYGVARGNCAEARRLYHERYPNRPIPHHNIFTRLHQRLMEHGSFRPRTADNGRAFTVATPQIEEAVLNEMDENPSLSTRRIARTLNISKSTVWRILKRQQLYPYHIQRVQALLPRDFPPRLTFCQWMQARITQKPNFVGEIMFTDEANFSRDGIFNYHNNHIWADENPHAISEGHHQQQFSVNVWAGIVGDQLIGPFFLPNRLTGQIYRHFLEEELPGLLEDVPLNLRNRMFFMHDGAPAHFSLIAREHLDEEYPNRWIGRGGPHPWPARSPELNCLDFFLWGHLKSLVYTTPIQNVQELRERIVAACDEIRNTPGIFQRVRESMHHRVQACITANGGHF